MRILASGDHHFCEHLRFEECVRVHEWMVGVARSERVDAFVSGGDVYERVSSPIERRAVANFLTPMAEICPVVISRGNHERELDVELMARLETVHPVIIESRAGVHVIGDAAIAAFAWPSRANLAAERSPEEIENAAREAFRNILLGLGQQLDEHPGKARILLGHALIDGSVVSTGQPLLGLPLNLGLTELALARPALGLFSHIHAHQKWYYCGVPYMYMGSPIRTDFGQLEPKVVVLFEFDGPRLVYVETIETPATKMIHIEAEFTDGRLELH